MTKRSTSKVRSAIFITFFFAFSTIFGQQYTSNSAFYNLAGEKVIAGYTGAS
ncbi:MAG: hypothetical protein HN704_09700 [Bacteroidetes bacterium]|nr:hypothetical protein [Bacteroidota bacterium]MBT7491869.1 hypothetical protein [Bacteroidota bacterium]